MALNVVEELIGIRKLCVSCRACENVCEKGAITLATDNVGFLRSSVDESKCIRCGRCSEICPLISPLPEIKRRQDYYAFRANAEIASTSSSGGAFPILADWMLARGGYVCGVILENGVNAVYAITKDKDIVQKMRGPKYAPSDMGHIYGEIKKKLDEGEDVLFVGMPCHVHALHNIVGDDPHLFTADIVCTGQPSPMIYSKYIEELSAEKPITSMDFNPRGQPKGSLAIMYADGTFRMSVYDPFVRACNASLIINQGCAACRFIDSRPGDITLGDLMGSDKVAGSAAGTLSLVMVNSQKGAAMAFDMNDSADFAERIPKPNFEENPGLKHERRLHLGWIRMVHFLQRGHPVAKSIDYCLRWKFDVGITGFWRVLNFGGELTYYALYHIIMDMGLEPLMIESRRKSKRNAPPNPPLLATKYPFYNIARWYETKEEQEELNNRVDNFIVGSDQVWNRRFITQDILECYTLDFVHDEKNKIAIASSFGTDRFEGTDEERESFAALLRRFNHLSVRESSAVELCKELGAEAEIIIDPVMLCDVKHFEALSDASQMRYPKQYAFNYMMHPVNFEGMEKIYEALGYGPVTAGNASSDFNERIDYPRTSVGTVENWMKGIKNSSFVVTDSFHGTVFSILFRKPFVTLIGNWNEGSGVGRITTLLTTLGLEERICKTSQGAIESGVLFAPIDYDEVHRKLDKEREVGMAWVKNALNMS